MATKIIIMVDDVPFEAELFDTPTGRAVEAALPIESSINTWGDEFYFDAGLGLELDDTGTTDVEVGDLGYWPDGDALCIFFGPTPASSGDKPVPASSVNILGKVENSRAMKELLGARKVILKNK